MTNLNMPDVNLANYKELAQAQWNPMLSRGGSIPKPESIKRVELASMTALFRRVALENAGVAEEELKAAMVEANMAEREMFDLWNVVFHRNDVPDDVLMRSIGKRRGSKWIEDAQEGLFKWAQEMVAKKEKPSS